VGDWTMEDGWTIVHWANPCLVATCVGISGNVMLGPDGNDRRAYLDDQTNVRAIMARAGLLVITVKCKIQWLGGSCFTGLLLTQSHSCVLCVLLGVLAVLQGVVLCTVQESLGNLTQTPLIVEQNFRARSGKNLSNVTSAKKKKEVGCDRGRTDDMFGKKIPQIMRSNYTSVPPPKK
jgi:hypothetical protein